MNRNNIILLVVVGIIILLGGFLIFSKKGTNNINDTGIVLFYSDSCIHCANVEKFITDNNIEQKFTFIKKEVSNNTDNANSLVKIGQFCKLSQEYIGAIPLLWDGANQKCIFGDVDIIKFFQDKINAQ